MKTLLLVLLTVFYLDTLQAENKACYPKKPCQCSKDSMKIKSIYAMPGEGNQAELETCLKILDFDAFRRCSDASINRKDCNYSNYSSIDEYCLTQLEQSPGTLDVIPMAPAGCKYKWKGFSMKRYREDVGQLIAKEKVRCSPSMCTSATFLALASHAKKLKAAGKIDEVTFKKLTTPGGEAYRILNTAAQPGDLVEKYGLGKAHVFRGEKISHTGNKVPKMGDLIQMWRKSGSGHSAVFNGFLDKDNDGKNDHICYWSSQSKTDGYGRRCEETSKMEQLLVGSLNG